jgi:hypothetical protein
MALFFCCQTREISSILALDSRLTASYDGVILHSQSLYAGGIFYLWSVERRKHSKFIVPKIKMAF